MLQQSQRRQNKTCQQQTGNKARNKTEGIKEEKQEETNRKKEKLFEDEEAIVAVKKDMEDEVKEEQVESFEDMTWQK